MINCKKPAALPALACRGAAYPRTAAKSLAGTQFHIIATSETAKSFRWIHFHITDQIGGGGLGHSIEQAALKSFLTVQNCAFRPPDYAKHPGFGTLIRQCLLITQPGNSPAQQVRYA